MSREPWNPTDDEHVGQCEQAGCKHPAVYELEDGTTAQGWCDLCRTVARESLSPEARELADEAAEDWLNSLDDDAKARLAAHLRRRGSR